MVQASAVLVDRESSQSRLQRSHRRRSLGGVLLALVIGVAGYSACSGGSGCGGGGGGGSCQACRDDCARAAIPASRCNCDGCTPP
jgi:hypothetical protein